MQTHQELRSEIACQVYGLLPKAIGCIPSANHDCRMHNLNSSRSSLSSGKLLSIVLPSVIDWHQSCKWQIFFHLLGRSLGSRRILGFTLKLKPLLPRASERGGGREGGGVALRSLRHCGFVCAGARGPGLGTGLILVARRVFGACRCGKDKEERK